jgi:hypothetical protein
MGSLCLILIRRWSRVTVVRHARLPGEPIYTNLHYTSLQQAYLALSTKSSDKALFYFRSSPNLETPAIRARTRSRDCMYEHNPLLTKNCPESQQFPALGITTRNSMFQKASTIRTAQRVKMTISSGSFIIYCTYWESAGTMGQSVVNVQPAPPDTRQFSYTSAVADYCSM